MNEYLIAPISNGNPREQALIRRWWHEEHEAKGLLVWEYYLEGRYLDAVWFPSSAESGVESDGKQTSARHPLSGQEVVLCEAKLGLTPELIGQALVYRQFALHAGADIKECLVFSEMAGGSMLNAATELGLRPIVYPTT